MSVPLCHFGGLLGLVFLIPISCQMGLVRVGVSRAVVTKGRSKEHDRRASHLPVLMNTAEKIHVQRFRSLVGTRLNRHGILGEISKARLPNGRTTTYLEIAESCHKRLEI